jgi:signal transduction histidine kinase
MSAPTESGACDDQALQRRERALLDLSNFAEGTSVLDLDATLRRLLCACPTEPGTSPWWVWYRGPGDQASRWVCVDPVAIVPEELVREVDARTQTAAAVAPSGRARVFPVVSGRVAPEDLRAELGGLGLVVEDEDHQDFLEAPQFLVEQVRVALILAHRNRRERAAEEMARSLAEAEDPHEALERLALTLREVSGADGVKVLWRLVHQGEACLQVVHRTGLGRRRSKPVPIDPNAGFANRVLSTGRWMLVDSPRGQADRAWRSGTGWEGVTGLRSVDFFPDLEPVLVPEERVQIYLPLKMENQTVGVLGVYWVGRTAPDAPLVADTLHHLAPHVASVCARIAALETLDLASSTAASLAGILAPDRHPSEAIPGALRELRHLAVCAQVLLYLADTRRPGRLHLAGSCNKIGSLHVGGSTELVRLDLPEDTANWKAGLARQLYAGGVHGAVRNTLAIPGSTPDSVEGMVILIDKADLTREPTFHATVRRRAVDSFLKHLGALLPNYFRARALLASESLKRVSHAATADQEVLEEAARIITEHIPDAAVFVYLRTADDVSLRVIRPYHESLAGLALGEPALARLAMTENAPLWVADLAAADEDLGAYVDQFAVGQIAGILGWGGARSLVACPLTDDSGALGVVKVLTPVGGMVLVKPVVDLVTAVSDRVIHDVLRGRRAQALHVLSELSAELAGIRGIDLGPELVARLGTWSREHLGRTSHLAVISWVGGSKRLVCAASVGIDQKALEGTCASRSGEEGLVPVVISGNVQQGTAIPLQLKRQPDLHGFFVVVGHQPFSDTQMDMLRDAAREISVLLQGEATADEWRFQEGVFRHALLGPVQGLVSAAEDVAHLAGEIAEDAPFKELNDSLAQLRKEAQAVKLWRETLRAIAPLRRGLRLQVALRPVFLNELLKTSMWRFEALFRQRGITCQLSGVPGGVQLHADQVLLELAIANLLDNALKYSFFNRTVHVVKAIDERDVLISIQDHGHGIPDSQHSAVYAPFGRPISHDDPLRSIQGEGLGLFLARAIAEAHGGSLEHTSELAGVPDRPEMTPHKVIFTLRIPHHWPSRRRP